MGSCGDFCIKDSTELTTAEAADVGMLVLGMNHHV